MVSDQIEEYRQQQFQIINEELAQWKLQQQKLFLLPYQILFGSNLTLASLQAFQSLYEDEQRSLSLIEQEEDQKFGKEFDTLYQQEEEHVSRTFRDQDLERLATKAAEEEQLRLARIDAEKRALMEEERLAKEEAEHIAQLEAEKKLQRIERERLAREEAQRQAQKEQERLAREEEERQERERLERERLQKEEEERLEQERLEKEQKEQEEREERERLEREQREREEQLEKERLKREEEERLAREEQERKEQEEREERERLEREEEERIRETKEREEREQREQQEQEERERLERVREQTLRHEQEENEERERQERERLEKEKIKQEKEKQDQSKPEKLSDFKARLSSQLFGALRPPPVQEKVEPLNNSTERLQCQTKDRPAAPSNRKRPSRALLRSKSSIESDPSSSSSVSENKEVATPFKIDLSALVPPAADTKPEVEEEPALPPRPASARARPPGGVSLLPAGFDPSSFKFRKTQTSALPDPTPKTPSPPVEEGPPLTGVAALRARLAGSSNNNPPSFNKPSSPAETTSTTPTTRPPTVTRSKSLPSLKNAAAVGISLPTASPPKATGMKWLLPWVQNCTAGYQGVNVTNFSRSWADGLAFCALVHYHFPNELDFNSLNPEEKAKNLKLAFDIAERKGVNRLLDWEDMIDIPPEPKSVQTYLAEMYNVFHK